MSLLKGDILKIMKSLDSNNVHNYDMISIRIIKICNRSVYKALNMVSKINLKSGKMLRECKKGNLAQSHKSEDKQLLILSCCFTSSKFGENLSTNTLHLGQTGAE